MKIHVIPVLQDNYAYLLEWKKEAAVVDPGEAGPVIAALEERGLHLSYILNTHHHGDHIGGNQELKRRYGATIVAPAEENRIPVADIRLKEKDRLDLGGIEAEVIETPGHTKHHICFYLPAVSALFTGDTLFSLGCGRLFEGTAAQMWNSLQKIMALPDDTQIYCGHEYTLSNGAFCLRAEPDNANLKARLAQAKELRERNLPTLPVNLGTEKKTNAFLRAGTAERFADLRALKDAA